MKIKEAAKRLAFISILFIILFNFPFIAVFNVAQSFLGIPILYLFVFGIWSLFLFIIFIFFRTKNAKDNKE